MIDAIAAVAKLAETVGPVAAVALALVGVLGFFYRRDIMKKLVSTKADHDRLLAAIESNAVANTKIADALTAIKDETARHETTHQRSLDSIGGVIEHSINNGFAQAIATLRLDISAQQRRGSAGL